MTDEQQQYDAPNQQVVRPDGSAPWDEGTGGGEDAAPEPEAQQPAPEPEAEREAEPQPGKSKAKAKDTPGRGVRDR